MEIHFQKDQEIADFTKKFMMKLSIKTLECIINEEKLNQPKRRVFLCIDNINSFSTILLHKRKSINDLCEKQFIIPKKLKRETFHEGFLGFKGPKSNNFLNAKENFY